MVGVPAEHFGAKWQYGAFRSECAGNVSIRPRVCPSLSGAVNVRTVLNPADCTWHAAGMTTERSFEMTEEQVAVIRRVLADGSTTQADLTSRYWAAKSTISKITREVIRSYIDVPEPRHYIRPRSTSGYWAITAKTRPSIAYTLVHISKNESLTTPWSVRAETIDG